MTLTHTVQAFAHDAASVASDLGSQAADLGTKAAGLGSDAASSVASAATNLAHTIGKKVPIVTVRPPVTVRKRRQTPWKLILGFVAAAVAALYFKRRQAASSPGPTARPAEFTDRHSAASPMESKSASSDKSSTAGEASTNGSVKDVESNLS